MSLHSTIENETDTKKFTWVIKNFSSLQSRHISSVPFVLGGYKWGLRAFTKGLFEPHYLTLCLQVADNHLLPHGWRRHARFNLAIVNQSPEKKSFKSNEIQMWFDQSTPLWISQALLPLSKLHAKDSGFFVNDEVKIVVEIDVVEVVGKLDVSDTATRPLKRIKLESMYVNGFQVLPSQVESVKRIFERHPDIAVEFRAKSQHLRTSCMNILLNLIQTLCHSLQDLSIDDLVEANNALTHLKHSGFKVDWLEKKLDQVKEKKKEEQIGETRTRELEQDLKEYKKKCSDIEAILEREKEELKKFKEKCIDIEYLLEKEKANVLAIRAPPLTFDDVI